MTNEQKAARLEAIALGKQCHAKDWSNGSHMGKMLSDAEVLLEGAAALRERKYDGWQRQFGRPENSVCVRNGMIMKVVLPVDNPLFHVWKVYGHVNGKQGYARTSDEAKSAASRWINEQKPL